MMQYLREKQKCDSLFFPGRDKILFQRAKSRNTQNPKVQNPELAKS